MGSPPLVRERLFFTESEYYAVRITPARAGKTLPILPLPIMYEDHPRSCGKDVVHRVGILSPLGSPPLVRERHDIHLRVKRQIGITPARAGKTCRQRERRGQPRDHPRSCGKDTSRLILSALVMGSPPLVRERQSSTRPAKMANGITPARAGKTVPGLGIPPSGGDHPRSCGKDPSCH